MAKKKKTNRKKSIPDLIAGLTVALVNIPEGMGYALAAGVNPIYGLYTGLLAPVVGALSAGSVYVVITLTNETALTTAATLESIDGWTMKTVFTLSILTGIFILIFARLKLGRLLRFVSESVMTGFITGAAVLVILGQLPDFTGFESVVGENVVQETLYWLTHLDQADLQTTLIGFFTLAVILLINKTKASKFSLIFAMVFASLLVLILRWDILLVGDIANITRGLPTPVLPDLSQVSELLFPAFSMAILAVAIGAGVAQNYPNPDGKTPDSNKDFTGIGAANTASGLFQGLPVTGSLSRTAVNVKSGAKSRMAVVFSGIILAVLLLTIAPLAELIPEASLAALLIFVGYEAINQRRVKRGWKTHSSGRIAMVATLVLALLIPLQNAIFAGILISLALFVYEASLGGRVMQWIPQGKGKFKEEKIPRTYPSGKITILTFYGSTFFAAVDKLVAQLPKFDKTKNAVIIINGKGRSITDTLLAWFETYIKDVEKSGSRLIMAELDQASYSRLKKTGIITLLGEENVLMETSTIHESLEIAIKEGNKWIKSRKKKT